MIARDGFRCVGAVLLACTFACAPAVTSTTPAPDAGVPVPGTSAAQRTTELPPIPAVDGPLQLEVGYPPEGSTIAARDSNFIFGSTGSGRTQLTINGAPVQVSPNGGFLAFIPVPPDGVYRLNATKDGASAALERRVNVPAAATPVRPGVTAPYPSGTLAVQRGETLEVGFRGVPGMQALLVLPDGSRIPLVEQGTFAESRPGDEFRTDAGQQRAPTSVRYAALVPIRAPIRGIL